jgi:hypothetical protein
VRFIDAIFAQSLPMKAVLDVIKSRSTKIITVLFIQISFVHPKFRGVSGSTAHSHSSRATAKQSGLTDVTVILVGMVGYSQRETIDKKTQDNALSLFCFWMLVFTEFKISRISSESKRYFNFLLWKDGSWKNYKIKNDCAREKRCIDIRGRVVICTLSQRNKFL